MYDFSSIELEDQPSVFVLPQDDCIFVTRALVAAGIDIECYGWSDIRSGNAPIDKAGADELAAGNPAWGENHALCAIVSRVPERFMREASMQVHCEPLDPDVAAYRAAIAARGNNIADASSFGSMDELVFCAREVTIIYAEEIFARVAEAEKGDVVVFSGSLDPLMYDEREHPVTFTGFSRDPVTSALREYSTSQICVVLRVSEDDEMPFYLEDAWPDVEVTIAQPTGRDLSELLFRGDAYKSAGPVERAFLERGVLPRHDHPMQFRGSDERFPGGAIVLRSPRIVDGVVCFAFIGWDKSLLAFATVDGDPAESPYVDEPGRTIPAPPHKGGDFLDDEAVFQAFAQDYPETAEVVIDLRERIERNMREYADNATTDLMTALETGDFSHAPVMEETVIPTDAGLFFPLHGENGRFVSYDDPEAASSIDMLRGTGWEGQMWVVSDKPWYRQRFGDGE